MPKDEKSKAKKSEKKDKTTKTKATKEKTTKLKAKRKSTKAKEEKPEPTEAKEENPEPTEAKEKKPEPTEAKEEKPTPAAKPQSKPKNTVFVGNKPAMTYVLAVMTCFNDNNATEVRICARGRAISSAVDVAELTRNKLMPDLKVKSIITSTEQVQRREGGGMANVSAIEIILSK